MTILKGSDAYHIAYGLHSHIPACCVDMWTYNIATTERARRIVLGVKKYANVHYIPCLGCIKKKTFNKIVDCDYHRIPCEFGPIDKGGERLSPPEKIKLSKDTEKALKKFKKKYRII